MWSRVDNPQVIQGQIVQGETFPGRPDARMTCQDMEAGQTEQAMEHPGVTQVDFWSFDLSFPDVLIPWLELADHKGPGKQIQDAVNGTDQAVTQDRNA